MDWWHLDEEARFNDFNQVENARKIYSVVANTQNSLTPPSGSNISNMREKRHLDWEARFKDYIQMAKCEKNVFCSREYAKQLNSSP